MWLGGTRTSRRQPLISTLSGNHLAATRLGETHAAVALWVEERIARPRILKCWLSASRRLPAILCHRESKKHLHRSFATSEVWDLVLLKGKAFLGVFQPVPLRHPRLKPWKVIHSSRAMPSIQEQERRTAVPPWRPSWTPGGSSTRDTPSTMQPLYPASFLSSLWHTGAIFWSPNTA